MMTRTILINCIILVIVTLDPANCADSPPFKDPYEAQQIDDAKEAPTGCLKLAILVERETNLTRPGLDDLVGLKKNCSDFMELYEMNITYQNDFDIIGEPRAHELNQVDGDEALKRQDLAMARRGIWVNYKAIMLEGFKELCHLCAYYNSGLLAQFGRICNALADTGNLSYCWKKRLWQIGVTCERRKRPQSSWDSVYLFQRLPSQPHCNWANIFILESLYLSESSPQYALAGVTNSLVRACLANLEPFFNEALENATQAPKDDLTPRERFDFYGLILAKYLLDNFKSKESSILNVMNPRSLFDNNMEANFFFRKEAPLDPSVDSKDDQRRKKIIIYLNRRRIYEDGSGICDSFRPDLRNKKDFTEHSVYMKKLALLFSINGLQFDVTQEFDEPQFRASLIWFVCQPIEMVNLELKPTGGIMSVATDFFRKQIFGWGTE